MPLEDARHLQSLNLHVNYGTSCTKKNTQLVKATTFASVNRPMSARLRRPSLDVIPENRMFNLRTYEKDTELELEEHDINYISSSSYDPRFPPNATLLNPHAARIGWMSTGLSPQVMSINLSSSWVFRKIVVKCFGAESVKLSVPGVPTNGLSLEKLNANEFIFDVKVRNVHESTHQSELHRGSNETKSFEQRSSNAGLDYIWGNQLILTFSLSSSLFVGVVNIRIIVVPYVVHDTKIVVGKNSP